MNYIHELDEMSGSNPQTVIRTLYDIHLENSKFRMTPWHHNSQERKKSKERTGKINVSSMRNTPPSVLAGNR